MQKDFMAMAQGQENKDISKEELQEAMLSKEDVETLGMPSGEDEASIKARFTQLFEEAGLMEMFQSPAEKQKFTQLLNELAAAFLNQDMQAITSNPLYQLLEQTMSSASDEVLSDGEEQPQGAPNFASMMPPPGGGMLGR